jgi:hypothetical protein
MATTATVINLPHPYTITNSTSGTTLASNLGITGSNVSWTTPNANFVNGVGKTVMTIPHGGDEVIVEPNASLVVKGSVKINGVDLEERLERIETLLHIPIRDVGMENEFPKLKKLWEEYHTELEKYKTWKRLNNG